MRRVSRVYRALLRRERSNPACEDPVGCVKRELKSHSPARELCAPAESRRMVRWTRQSWKNECYVDQDWEELRELVNADRY